MSAAAPLDAATAAATTREALADAVREAARRPAVSGARQILTFDFAWLAGAGWTYGLAAILPVTLLARSFEAGGPVLFALAVPLAWFVFLMGVIGAIAVVSFLLPPEKPGLKTVFVGRDFAVFLARWGLDSYLVPPLRQHVQLLTATRYCYFRAMGMKLHWSAHISPGAKVISPGLVTLGRGTFLGEGAYVSAHLSVGDRMLATPIVIGDQANIGAHTNVGPGVHIGPRTKVGALVDIAPDARIGADVLIGPRCHIGMGAVIEDGAALDPRTYVPSYAHVAAGTRWAGDPGEPVGRVRGGAGKAQRRRKGVRGEAPSSLASDDSLRTVSEPPATGDLTAPGEVTMEWEAGVGASPLARVIEEAARELESGEWAPPGAQQGRDGGKG